MFSKLTGWSSLFSTSSDTSKSTDTKTVSKEPKKVKTVKRAVKNTKGTKSTKKVVKRVIPTKKTKSVKYTKVEELSNKKEWDAPKTVKNYMGAPNYVVSPLTQLRMLATTWFLGEPTYYQSSKSFTLNDSQLKKVGYESELMMIFYSGETTDSIFTKTVCSALDENYSDVLDLAVKCRQKYNMRLTPTAILATAIFHKNRVTFNQNHPGKMKECAEKILHLPTDCLNLIKIWKSNTNKAIPSIVKRIVAKKLETMKPYQMKKYLHKAKIVDLIRISHPRSCKNELIKEVVKTGDLVVKEDQKTWETLKSSGKKWKEIVDQLGYLPHMALLRNLRGMEGDLTKGDLDKQFLEHTIVNMLKKGVKGGRQFPFRYMTAYENVTNTELKKALSECVDIAMDNFPKLRGNTACLSDNSGSAWGTFPSQYGSQTVAKIANLSSLMTAKNCTGRGVVGTFGDRLELIEVDKEKPVLEQVENIHAKGQTVGGGTENGVWLFFKQAFADPQKYHFDNIFIYSDMQCGHGGLYGTNPEEYKKYIVGNGNSRYSYICTSYINVLKLVENYRKVVNPKVNVFMVQVAAYNNTLIPEMLYRSHIMSGWTGNEVLYAEKMNELMDEYDKENDKSE